MKLNYRWRVNLGLLLLVNIYDENTGKIWLRENHDVGHSKLFMYEEPKCSVVFACGQILLHVYATWHSVILVH